MKRLAIVLAALCGACAATPTQQPAGPGTVKITPLGSHDGEFCALDRALIFEDPDGTRILYDVGRTVRGPNDPRLGKIDAVLLSHVHGDHIGDSHQPAANAGACGKPDFSVNVTPVSNTVNVVVAKKSKLIVGAEMGSFFAAKVRSAGGDAAQVQLSRFGAMAQVGGVRVATVPAVHSNGLPPEFLDKNLGDALRANGLTAYLGPPSGYILIFTNGLVAYLSGDTGITAEQDLVVRRHYRANLAVINIGGVFTTGPAEAAFVITDLVKPNAVIASHANEPATEGGKVRAGTRTETFIKQVAIPAHVPLSGRTMAFDGSGRCVSGC
ncbi:MAG TPA: MBL fold metallo-hydrolase [Burkholderiales bacterium]|nr:MBL fold metallo-hydrolase [Burkholderiales bacterium]